jgi:tRNA A-37 threonylcarbamoyl transferase component Bud32
MAQVVFCPTCGAGYPAGTRFCSNCGAALDSVAPRQATGMLPANRLLKGQYLILKKLAQGGQSAVYLAADTLKSSSRVAIKEMSEAGLDPAERDQAVNDFLREAGILIRLNHPALVKVYATFVEDGKHFMVMEYVEGRTLEDELEAIGKPLPEDRVLNWALELCDVLGYLHGQDPPIIYRDLKPGNIMLTADGKVKLIDFGIARFQQTGQSKDTVCLGTDGYAPIEQYSGHTEPRSDIYALGATLYHLLTNKVPPSAPARVADQGRITAPRQLNPALSPAIDHIVLKAMGVHPSERYADVAELRLALRAGAAADGLIAAKVHSAATSAPKAGTMTQVDPRSRPVSPAPGALMLTIPPLPGIGGRPVLRVSPAALDFGLVSSGMPKMALVLLVNEGGRPLEVEISSTDPALRLSVADVRRNQGRVEVWLASGMVHAGPHTAALRIASNGGNAQLPVVYRVRGAASPPAPRPMPMPPVPIDEDDYEPQPMMSRGVVRMLIGLAIGLAWLLSTLPHFHMWMYTFPHMMPMPYRPPLP